MLVSIPYIHKLIKTGALTSPLLGLFSFAQMFVIVDLISSISPERVFLPGLTPLRMIAGISLVTFIAATFWAINIGLLYGENRLRGKVSSPWRYVVSFIVVLAWAGCMMTFMEERRPIDTPRSILFPLIGTITNNSIILILIDLVIAKGKKAQLELDKAHLEVAHLAASQKHLINQIHPHFLFNALGTLKILIASSPLQAETYVSRLSRFLRSSITTAEHDLVTIDKELQLFTDYMELQRMRFQKGIDYVIDIPDEIRQKGKLPLFTLQLFAENAIHHNGFTEANNLTIKLLYQIDGTLRVENNIIPKFATEPSTGTGLQNLSQRFQLLGMAKPIIHNDGKNFTVVVNVSTAGD